MAEPMPFFVFTAPRSGSSWLLDLLSSHPAVLAYGELFSIELGDRPDYGSQDMRYFEAHLKDTTAPASRDQSSERTGYLRQLYAPRPGIGAIGFKLVYGRAGRRPGLLQELATLGARAVHLMRANFLEAVVSFETAKANGQFHVRGGSRRRSFPYGWTPRRSALAWCSRTRC